MKAKPLHLILALAALATGSLFAQENDAKPGKQKYTLHIVKDENGKTQTIDKAFATKEELDAFVKTSDLDGPQAFRPEPPSPPSPPTTPTPPAKPTKPRIGKNADSKEKKIIIIEKEEGGLNGKTGFSIDLSQLPEDDVIKLMQEIINLNIAKVEVQHLSDKKETNQLTGPGLNTGEQKNDQRTGMDAPPVNSENVANLKVYPNPGRQFHVECNVNKPGNVKLYILDMQGKEVYEEAMNNYTGKLEKDIDAAQLAKGTYLMAVEAGGARATTTVVLQ